MRTPPAALAGIGSLALSLACAHAPTSVEPSELARPPLRQQRMLVTGSHIPQYVDTRTCVPETSFQVLVYSREALLTANAANLRAALTWASPTTPCEP